MFVSGSFVYRCGTESFVCLSALKLRPLFSQEVESLQPVALLNKMKCFCTKTLFNHNLGVLCLHTRLLETNT